MDISSILRAKRDGRELSPEQIQMFVEGAASGALSDAQVSAWLMAAYINGLTDAETASLTLAMSNSGERVAFEQLARPVVDKHSTGGIGDSVSLILLPILAACGVTMVKLSGAGLGHTGGTLDKLASIPGFRTDLSSSELQAIAQKVGCALGGQTARIAPADRRLYALRSETQTVASIPLIAASVMSKKLAVDSDAVVLDVKVGSGAFTPHFEDARKLASTMVGIGERVGRPVRALITDMNQPLSCSVGNSLELCSAIEELKSGCAGRLGRVTLAIAQQCLEAGGKSPELAERAVRTLAAVEKMQDWISAQGGNPDVVDAPRSVMRDSAVRGTWTAPSSGFVSAFDCRKIGEACVALGAGRARQTDELDYSAGLQMKVELGSQVATGDTIATLHTSNAARLEAAENLLDSAVQIGESPPQLPPLIHEIL